MAVTHRRTALGPAFVALAASLTATAAVAAEPKAWYAGVTSDATHVEVWRGVGWEQSGEQAGLAAYGGLRINEHFAVELASRHAANLEWTEYFATSPPGIPGVFNGRSRFDAGVLEVVAVGILPFARYFEGLFTAGIARYRVSGDQALEDSWNHTAFSRPIRGSGTGQVLGVGAAATVNENWRVKVEYRFFGIDGDFLGVPTDDDPTVDSFSIGVDYRFGRRARNDTEAATAR